MILVGTDQNPNHALDSKVLSLTLPLNLFRLKASGSSALSVDLHQHSAANFALEDRRAERRHVGEVGGLRHRI